MADTSNTEAHSTGEEQAASMFGWLDITLLAVVMIVVLLIVRRFKNKRKKEDQQLKLLQINPM